METHDISIEKAHRTEELERQIDSAIANRRKIIFTRDRKSAVEDEELLKQGKFPDIHRPSFVHTKNAHEYRELLLLAYHKLNLALNKHIPEEKVQRMVDDDLKHEFEHHISLLGDEAVDEVWYGIEFFEDKKTKLVGHQVSITVPGAIPEALYEEYVHAPEEKSRQDRTSLKELHKRQKNEGSKSMFETAAETIRNLINRKHHSD